MYYITSKKSETGKKLLAVAKKVTDANNEAMALTVKLGAKSCRMEYFVAGGGISSMQFDTSPPKDAWKRVQGGWLPKYSTKEGKEIGAKIKALPTVGYHEVNNIIGWKGGLSCIGYAIKNKTHVAIQVNEEWNVKMPDDCEEITTTKFREMFKL